jgi:hypothetical protein
MQRDPSTMPSLFLSTAMLLFSATVQAHSGHGRFCRRSLLTLDTDSASMDMSMDGDCKGALLVGLTVSNIGKCARDEDVLPWNHWVRQWVASWQDKLMAAVWFASWMPSSAGAVVGTCIGLFLFGIFERFLAAFKRAAETAWLES